MDSLIRDIMCIHPQVIKCQQRNDLEGIEEWGSYFRGFNRNQLQEIRKGLQDGNQSFTEAQIVELENDLDRF
jgi:hypothetical protein